VNDWNRELNCQHRWRPNISDLMFRIAEYIKLVRHQRAVGQRLHSNLGQQRHLATAYHKKYRRDYGNKKEKRAPAFSEAVSGLLDAWSELDQSITVEDSSSYVEAVDRNHPLEIPGVPASLTKRTGCEASSPPPRHLALLQRALDSLDRMGSHRFADELADLESMSDSSHANRTPAPFFEKVMPKAELPHSQALKAGRQLDVLWSEVPLEVESRATPSNLVSADPAAEPLAVKASALSQSLLSRGREPMMVAHGEPQDDDSDLLFPSATNGFAAAAALGVGIERAAEVASLAPGSSAASEASAGLPVRASETLAPTKAELASTIQGADGAKGTILMVDFAHAGKAELHPPLELGKGQWHSRDDARWHSRDDASRDGGEYRALKRGLLGLTKSKPRATTVTS
jgi:hypothetical protein